jgi:chromosome segregation ATPase
MAAITGRRHGARQAKTPPIEQDERGDFMRMSELEEYQRRITAAMDRMAKGLDQLNAAPAEPDEDIVQALEDERQANAQLTDRVKTLKESHQDELSALRDQMEFNNDRVTQLDMDVQRLRQANEQLSAANAEGLADPKLIDTAVIAELESLRATRAIEMAEIDAVLTALAPLVEEGEPEPAAPAEDDRAEEEPKSGGAD